MAVPYSLKNATVTIYDDTSTTRQSLVLTLEDGDLSLTMPNPAEHVLDRGDPGTAIDGTHEDITGTMTVQVASFTGAESIPKVFGGTATSWAYHKNDLATAPFGSAQTSIQDIATAVKVWQMGIVMDEPTGGTDETLLFVNCHTDSLTFTEGMPDKFSVAFTCLGYTLADFLANMS